MKSQRAFWMQVEGATRTWTFQSPLTLELEVERGIFQSLSEGVFRVYNLSGSTRSDIFQDWLHQNGKYRSITVRAGYLSWSTTPGGPSLNTPSQIQALPIIFSGSIIKAYSQREGPSWVTTIMTKDGIAATTQADVSVTLTANTPLNQIVQQLITAMPGLQVGYIDPSLKTSNLRGISLSGSPWDKLADIADAIYADLFIDLGKVYFIAKGSPVPNVVGLGTISSAQGLLETPLKQGFLVSFEMLFEPRLKVGQAFVLDSIETVNNGTYTLAGIAHRGTISEAVAGDLRTKVTGFDGKGAQASGAIQ